MKLLIVAGIYPPTIGGSATYSALLARELPKRGFEITVLIYGKADGAVGVSNFWPKGLRHLIYFWKLLRLAKKNDAVLAADSSFGAATIAALVCRLTGKKLLVRVTGDYAWEQGVQRFGVRDLIDTFQSKKYGWRVSFLRWAQKFSVKSATTVIAPSEYLRRLAIGWGADPEKVKVINNAVDLPQISEGGYSERSEEFYKIISAGRLVPWKGFEVLIEAVSELRSEIPEIKLIIIGSGPEESYLKAISYKLKSDVKFTGSISKDKLVERIENSNIFVLNTAYEGFSHQIVEAMSLGAPVITTNVGGNPEIIKDGENGLLVGYNDKEAIKNAILKLYRNKDLALRLAKKGAEDTKRYSVEVMIGKILSHF